MMAFTCPHCGGSVHYEIGENGIRCEYCSGLIDLDSYQAYLDTKQSYQATELCCPQCGAVTLSYDNTLATFCSYCGSSVIFDQRVRETEKPAGMLRFKLGKQAAMNRYRKRVDGVLLAPDWIREEGELHPTGLYLPYYEYSATMEQPGRYRATKTRVVGKYNEVSEYEISGVVRADYRGNRFDAAMAFPDAMSETLDDFDWQGSETFQPGYMAGFYADGSDVEGAEYDPLSMSLILTDINDRTLDYQGMSFNVHKVANENNLILRRKKVLYPVWLLTHRLGKDRICYGAVNGRSGAVAADIPLDGGKYVKLSLIVASFIALILNAVTTILPNIFLGCSMLLTAIFGVVLGKLAQDVYIRENHLDDVGRVGYETFVSALKRRLGQKNGAALQPSRKMGCAGWLFMGLGIILLAPFAEAILEGAFPALAIRSGTFTGLVLFVVVIQFFASSITRSVQNQQPARWRFSVPKLVAFSVLWKIWLALAAGALVAMSGTVEDNWYYGAGILNIAVCIWGAFDLIRKQNRLASREVPVFTIKRGGQE